MKNRQVQRRWRSFLVDQDGAIAIVIAILLPVLLGFAGLAIDIGHLYVVESQLKNAADAGALAGARGIVPYTQSTVAGKIEYTPKWLDGTTEAQKAVAQNSADGNSLAISTANPGATPPTLRDNTLLSIATPCYWNLNTKTIKSTASTPVAFDVPAMHVRVSKTDGQNNGAVKMFLASIFGVLSADRLRESVAIVSFNSGIPAGSLKPMVATKHIVDFYWDKQNPDHLTEPFQFTLGDGNKADEDTMWTSFLVAEPPDKANAAILARGLIRNGNPDPISIGSPIYLQPGAEATLYGDTPGEVITGMGDFINQTVVLPIVEPYDLVHKQTAAVQGFIAFHITGFNQGGKYIRGYLDKNIISNPYQNITGFFGAPAPTIFNPPQLVY